MFLLLPLMLAGCGHKQAAEGDAGGDKKDAPRPVVQVVPVTRETLERTLPVTGVLQALPGQEAVLSPPVAGVIETLSARYAQTVRRGQVVAQLSTQQLLGQIQQAQATLGQNQVQVQQAEANALQQQAQTRTAILQAQAAVNNAQATLAGAAATLTGDEASLHNAQQNLSRAQTLFQDGLVPQRDVETAQLAVRTAQATLDAQRQTVAGQRQTVAGQRQAVAAARAASLQDIVKRKDIQVARRQVQNAQGALDTARAQKALYTIHAPLSGQVTVVGANVGETVDTATKIVTITNLDRLQLQLSLPTSGASTVRAGERVTFTVESVPGQTFQSVVTRVGSQVDPATGTVPAFAVVANPGHRLRDDTTVQAHVLTERRASVLSVPASAVLTDPDTGKPSVTAVGADEVAHVIPVVVGLAAGGRVEIRSGVKEGQRVAVSGQYGLPDGTAVTAQNAGGAASEDAAPPKDLTAPGSPGTAGGANAPSAGGANAPSGTPAPASGPGQSAPGVSSPQASPDVPNAPTPPAPSAGGGNAAGATSTGNGGTAGSASPVGSANSPGGSGSGGAGNGR